MSLNREIVIKTYVTTTGGVRPNLGKLNLTVRDLRKAYFEGYILASTNFDGSDLADSNFSGSFAEATSYTYTNLTNVRFISADVKTSNFNFANLSNTDFTNADLTGSRMVRLRSESMPNFTNARMAGVVMSRAD